MVDLSWIYGHARTSYTIPTHPAPLLTKSGKTTTLSEIAQSSIPPCRLNPFLFNGHLQTMYTVWKNPGPPTYYKRRLFDSDHSVYPGTFAVDFVVSREDGETAAKLRADTTLPERTTNFTDTEFEGLASDDTKPMLIALHGLTGGSHEVYLRETLAPLTAHGWEACVVNGRGCAMSKITTPQLFNSRATWDVRQTVKLLHRMFPNRPLYGVGFSLGANILTNYVGEEGDRCILKAAVACSNPWNLEVCNVELARTWLGKEVYLRVMGKNMMGLFNQHRELILQNKNIDLEAVMSSKYLHEFDRHIQCPTWGYPTEGAYYRDSQSVDALLAAKIPLLGINAEDDPISCVNAIPFQEFKQNPHAVLCTTTMGGHLGSFQLGGTRWFAVAASAFLTKMHDEIDFEASKVKRQETDMETPEKKYPIFDPNHRRLILPDL